MKTQINNLRSGNQHIVLNKNVDYPSVRFGSNLNEKREIGVKVFEENGSELLITLGGIEKKYTLKLETSISGKTKSYVTVLSIEDTRFIFGQNLKNQAALVIDQSCSVYLTAGKSILHLCPSLITIH